jgi:Asp-tRNA(Asn)/Glu-tRNA(Gln) amidotransferase A subunit family amidase
MRPSAGLVSRTGVYSGWPLINSSLGPMARTVADLAKVLDVIVGYDPEDPVTARGFGRYPAGCLKSQDKNALRQARIGILRESIGNQSEPDSEDFKNVTEVFVRAIDELKAEGAEIVDPVIIPNLKALLAKRASLQTEEEEAFAIYFGRNGCAPYQSRTEAMQSPDFPRVLRFAQMKWRRNATPAAHYEYLKAREQLLTSFLKVMADHRLDAIVHKAVEHQPTLIKDAFEPPYANLKGAISINTFLAFVPSIVVPAGFTRDNLPAGITFLGRPYDDGHMVQLAYAYEQATRHRRSPACMPF